MDDPVIHADAFNLLCGRLLGEGIHRKVFECKLRPELVVKVEYDTDYRYFANVHEMKFWSDAPPKVRRWLAPCEYLSPDGLILLQRKVEPVRKFELLDKLPAFLGDFKLENYGILDQQFVCVDYAMVRNNLSLRLKKVNWT